MLFTADFLFPLAPKVEVEEVDLSESKYLIGQTSRRTKLSKFPVTEIGGRGTASGLWSQRQFM